MSGQENPRKSLSTVKRVVIKVGTSSITDSRSRLDPQKVGKLVASTMALRALGKEVIIVSSGAIGAGVGRLNLKRRPEEMSSLQATAAVGQGILMQTYTKYFGEYQQPVAQILLTAEDLREAVRYKNFRNMLAILMKWGVVPIVNENDSVAWEEIKVGDNDILSAHVAIGAKADLLVILSDVEGLYMDYANKGKRGKLIHVVERVADVEKHVSKSPRGFGGMSTKLRAAKMATEQGIPVVIATGGDDKVLERMIDGEEVGTLFLPKVGKS